MRKREGKSRRNRRYYLHSRLKGIIVLHSRERTVEVTEEELNEFPKIK